MKVRMKKLLMMLFLGLCFFGCQQKTEETEKPYIDPQTLRVGRVFFAYSYQYRLVEATHEWEKYIIYDKTGFLKFYVTCKHDTIVALWSN